MTEIMPVPRNLILLSYQQRAFYHLFLFIIFSILSKKTTIIIEVFSPKII